VTVSVKNKTNASTTTNANGDYSIMASSGDVLLLSSVGYTDLEERVGSGNSLNISMAYSATNMNEVVVVGYGTQRKKDVTGAVVSLKTDRLPQTANTSINNLLQGRAAGLNLDL